jgi:putative heme-binding domain-containing protein
MAGIVRAAAIGWMLLANSLNCHAAEPWADSNLPVLDGLELWLDANRASDSREQVAAPLAIWRDASGNGHHVRQEEPAAQPTWQKVGSSPVVRFDGIDDCLRAVSRATELRAFTVYIVAAPKGNVGAFSGLMALSANNQRDYMSGMAIDLGPWATAEFVALNVEGRGFGGVKSLRTAKSPFGRLESLEITSDQGSVQLFVNGQPEGKRNRADEPISMDEITIGARHFNNDAGPQRPTGYVLADIAEIIVFNRALSASEREKVGGYLREKHKELSQALLADVDTNSERLVSVPDPPAVQMFVPGFSVRELPVELSNINNVKYRSDGTLVALAYDGKVWLLRDTDRDGLEDKADLFWNNPIDLRSPIGMDLTPPGYQRGNGLFVVGKTRCLLIVDTDGDDRADKEIDVAHGWQESFHTVDGLGVAFDVRDGCLYYGRGTYNFADPLLRDKDGVSKYSLTDESGAIIRVSPDFKTREVVATGIRFPVALRINRHGDLFASDQEGATWVPNGNPFDELLHIQDGRHYGFPARHPRYLPDVIDEPSTFDYRPQHQCVCGFNFNEPVAANGPTFGPAAWRGDAIVTGYSRGKLYLTRLVKTAPGYVADNQLIACLRMMPVDVCVAADGELVVACHSGGPDWGSGPTGAGKLFKIAYTDPEAPQPALIWPSGPREVRIEFDRQVDAEQFRGLLDGARLTAGAYVSAGDRFESLWPGYAAVQTQKLTPRYDVPIHSVQLSPDRRTLFLATNPISRALQYALVLPATVRSGPRSAPEHSLAQHAAIDLDFDLSGCEADWRPVGENQAWRGWLPHIDTEVSKELTAGSAMHEALWRTSSAGELSLRTRLDLTDMLRPAVQPGSTLDYEYQPEAVTVTIAAKPPEKLRLTVPGVDVRSSADGSTASFTVPAGMEKSVVVDIRVTTDTGIPELTASWTTNEDDRPRPFPLRRMMLPWAELGAASDEAEAIATVPELEGGSWARGSHEFFGDEAACSKCHAIHGRGGSIGPNLSNLVHRDYASVLRDITNPGFAINPDHVTHTVVLTDGRVFSGVVSTTGDLVTIGDVSGNLVQVDRAEIDEMEPSSVSTMPDDLTTKLGPKRVRDLLTFLLTPPPQMPRDHAGPPPPPRTVADVNAALAGAPTPSPIARPIHIVLVAGPKDHGPGEHDYPAWQKAWSELLASSNLVEVSTAWEWPTKEQFGQADAVVFYQHGDWNDERAADIDAYLDRGGGLVYIHWAVDGREHGQEMARRIGMAAGGPIAFRHGETTLQFNRPTNHPIIRNFEKLSLFDETYWRMRGSVTLNQLLGTAIEDGEPQPQLWVVERSKGRVFVSIPGHFSWTFDDPLFRLLLLRGIAWVAREPVDRFNDLVWPGARVVE